MGKKIVLISSGQPSLNPRLVKEADALANANYDVTVLYAYWNDWGTRFDEELIPTKNWKAICIGGDPEYKKFTWFLSRAIYKAARLINQITGGKNMAEFAIARSSWFLMREAPKYPADIYIGHNIGALPATIKAARANKKPCGFDAEDLHRFEISNDKDHPDVMLKTQIENKYIPQSDYLTASSPQIAAAYQKLFPGKTITTIRNVFPVENEIAQPAFKQTGPIKLFWFSQTIGLNRGLQDAINALNLLKEYPFEFHLLGHNTGEIDAKISGMASFSIYFHEPVAPDELAKFSSRFDIGLALEPGFSINNDLALSNKIFTYLQAGLCIIASDTAAQKDFLSKHPATGQVYKRGDIESLSDTLLQYHQNRDKLLEAKKASFSLAKNELNWENEQKIFLKVVENALQKS